MEDYLFKKIELECPKCAYKGIYQIRYSRVYEEGKLRLKNKNKTQCKLCKALLQEQNDLQDIEYEKLREKTLRLFDYAKRLVLEYDYKDQIKWLVNLLEHQIYKEITMPNFFREYVWVVFTTGFKADIIRKHWPKITDTLSDFNINEVRKMSAEWLLENLPIKNKAKCNAIYKTSTLLNDEWLESIKNADNWKLIKDTLIKLPFIGKVTVWHLMRNIGVDCFKPDRHIERLSSLLNIQPKILFEIIIHSKHEKYVGVADYILWRACATLGNADRLLNYAIKIKAFPKQNNNMKITDYLF